MGERAITLDENERAGLLALREQDPEGESWVTPWASGMAQSMKNHGADLVAQTYHGSIGVFRRLANRKLLEGEPGVRGEQRGYALAEKGKVALAQIDAETAL